MAKLKYKGTNPVFRNWNENLIGEVTYSADNPNAYYGQGEAFNGDNGNYARDGSHAEGKTTCAAGSCSHTEGQNTKTYDYYAHAEGYNTYAGYAGHAEGASSSACGWQCHAEGYGTYTGSNYSHAEGNYSRAMGTACHAEGQNCVATGNYSHSEGYGSYAANSGTHAEGYNCSSLGYDSSHAEGGRSVAYGSSSHAEGYQTCAMGNASHAEGYQTLADPGYGYYAHTEGYRTTAYYYAHAEGNTTYACYHSHAEGYFTSAMGSNGSHAEGNCSCATGSNSSHAEGYQTLATASNGSHSEGYYTSAFGINGSHAGGDHALAKAQSSFAHGLYTEAKNIAETAFGRYNASTDNGSSWPEYQANTSYYYNVNYPTYVKYDGKIYFLTSSTPVPAGPFDPSYWEEIGSYSENGTLFSVGNGRFVNGAPLRSNAFEVLDDGTANLNGKSVIAANAPLADGTYTLQCTVSNGIPTFFWGTGSGGTVNEITEAEIESLFS